MLTDFSADTAEIYNKVIVTDPTTSETRRRNIS